MSAKIKPIEAEPCETESPYMTPKEVSELFRVHPETLRRWAAKGILRPTVLGGTWRYLRVEIERFEQSGSLELDRTRRKAAAKAAKEARLAKATSVAAGLEKHAEQLKRAQAVRVAKVEHSERRI